MRIGISGSGGLVGGHLMNLVRLLGHEPIRLVRHGDSGADAVNAWPVNDGPGRDLPALEGVGAVVHLAGKSIASDRWTREVKRQIRDSRVIKTRQLCESLARLVDKPEVLVCASATGIYGDRGDEVCDESTSPGGDFLAEVAEQWEAACRPATDAGIRVVHARFGLVLSPQGGALEKMLLPAKLCGGKLGSGDQWYSWISIDDAIGALYHCVADQSVNGPVNFVAPNPVPNAEFARTLGRVLGRPALFPAPAFGLRLALGEMADALLLGGVRVAPLRLQQAGYRFRFSGLEEALRYLLGKNRLSGSGAPASGE